MPAGNREPIDAPCRAGHVGKHFMEERNDGRKIKLCLICRSEKTKLKKSQRLPRDAKVGALLAAGVTLKDISNQVDITVSGAANLRGKILSGENEAGHAAYVAAKHAAAKDVLPLAREAAIRTLTLGLSAMNDGTSRCAGLDDDGKAVMVSEKPGLKELSSFLRESAYLAGVGKGGVLSSDGEQQQHEMRKAVVSKIQWNDPAVLAAAMQLATGIANDTSRVIEARAETREDAE